MVSDQEKGEYIDELLSRVLSISWVELTNILLATKLQKVEPSCIYTSLCKPRKCQVPVQ